MRYKFIKNWANYKIGDVVQLDNNDFFTMYFVKKGIAEQYIKKQVKVRRAKRR